MQDFLTEERKKMLELSTDISKTYSTLFDSLVLIRNQVFPVAFESDENWHLKLHAGEVETEKTYKRDNEDLSESQRNSTVLIRILNNILSIQEKYLVETAQINRESIRKVIKADNYLKKNVTELFHTNSRILSIGEKQNFTHSIFKNIEESLEMIIKPFWMQLDRVLIDIDRLTLKKSLMQNPASESLHADDRMGFTNLITELCKKNGIIANSEIIETAVSDFIKSEDDFSRDILKPYESDDKSESVKISRTKKILYRYMAQEKNLSRVLSFLEGINKPKLSLTQRIFDFFLQIFTGSGLEVKNKEFFFTFSSRKGKITRKEASLLQLINQTKLFIEYLNMLKTSLDSTSEDKKSATPQTMSEMNNMVDKCFVDLNQIYDQSNGFREWLSRKKNEYLLYNVPIKLQEEYTTALININQTLIINRENIYDMEKKYKSIT